MYKYSCCYDSWYEANIVVRFVSVVCWVGLSRRSARGTPAALTRYIGYLISALRAPQLLILFHRSSQTMRTPFSQPFIQFEGRLQVRSTSNNSGEIHLLLQERSVSKQRQFVREKWYLM